MEATKKLFEYAFSELGLDRLVAFPAYADGVPAEVFYLQVDYFFPPQPGIAHQPQGQVVTRILCCQVEHSGDDTSFDIGCKMPGYFYGEDQVFALPFVESLECGRLAGLPCGLFCAGSS